MAVSLKGNMNWKLKRRISSKLTGRTLSFSLTLTSDVIKFCDKTINKASDENEQTKTELNVKLDTTESHVIFSTLEKNDGRNRKHFQQCSVFKTKKEHQSSTKM